MTFVDAFAPDMVLGPDQVLPTVPRDFGERFDLNWKAARSPDKFFFYESRMMALWDDALDQLNRATGQTFPNPFRLAAGKQPRTGIFGEALPEALTRRNTARRDDVLPDILAAFDQARAGQFDLPDPRRFEDRIRGEAQKLRQDAERSALASYGAGGLGAFLGAAAGEMSHPVNLATLPIGGSYALGNIARIGLLRFLGRNALIEGGVAAASQAAIEALDAPYQERLATDTGLADRIERILIAGAGGAALGLGLSGLAAAARGLRRGARMTLDEADALKVAERASYAERNPLGPDGANAHAKALDTAEVQVAAGRHADVRPMVREEMQRQRRAEADSAGVPADFKPTTEELIAAREVMTGRLFGQAPKEPPSLSQFVRAKGGIDIADNLAGDLRAMDINQLSGLLRKRREGGVKDMQGAKERLGRSADDMAEAAWAEGFYHERPTREEFIADLIDDHQGARKIYADLDRAAEYDQHLTDQRNFQHYIENLPFNPEGMREREIAWRLRQIPAARAPDVDSVPFDPFDSDAATRPIADAAPVPPERPPTGMKDAKADEARAMVLQKDFEMDVPSGDGFVKRKASEVLAEADERVKAAKLAAECAAGGAIG